MADGHLHVQAGRQVRVRGGVPGRLLALCREPGALPEPDGGVRRRDLPGCGRGILPSEGDAERPGAAVLQLARDEPLRVGARQGPGKAPGVAAAAPDDAWQGGALLGEHVAGVFGAGAV